ncbi:hypothetical protein FACS189499_02220 [Clostridia bacterium]|nr:hypothetical protein FACS189499_02220 [Clostridia bacterium]
MTEKNDNAVLFESFSEIYKSGIDGIKPDENFTLALRERLIRADQYGEADKPGISHKRVRNVFRYAGVPFLAAAAVLAVVLAPRFGLFDGNFSVYDTLPMVENVESVENGGNALAGISKFSESPENTENTENKSGTEISPPTAIPKDGAVFFAADIAENTEDTVNAENYSAETSSEKAGKVEKIVIPAETTAAGSILRVAPVPAGIAPEAESVPEDDFGVNYYYPDFDYDVDEQESADDEAAGVYEDGNSPDYSYSSSQALRAGRVADFHGWDYDSAYQHLTEAYSPAEIYFSATGRTVANSGGDTAMFTDIFAAGRSEIEGIKEGIPGYEMEDADYVRFIFRHTSDSVAEPDGDFVEITLYEDGTAAIYWSRDYMVWLGVAEGSYGRLLKIAQ